RIVDAARGVAHAGTYLDIDSPSRLVLALSLDSGRKAITRVVVDIEQRRKGCAVTVVHHDVPRERARAVADRWCGMLYGLDEILASDPVVQRRIRPLFASHSTFAWRNSP